MISSPCPTFDASNARLTLRGGIPAGENVTSPFAIVGHTPVGCGITGVTESMTAASPTAASFEPATTGASTLVPEGLDAHAEITTTAAETGNRMAAHGTTGAAG